MKPPEGSAVLNISIPAKLPISAADGPVVDIFNWINLSLTCKSVVAI